MSNELPKDWKWVKMGEIFTIERGGSPRPIEDFVTEDSNGINWIKIGDTKGVVKYIYKTKEKIKPAGASRSRMVYEDDFILSNSMSFGKPFIMKTTGCIHDGWLVIRKNETIDNNFLYYILSSPIVFQQFTKLAKGSTVKNLNIEAVKQVELRIPPKPTQQAIVSKIEELFSEIENGIESLFTAQQQLKTYRQSVLKWAFEGKLTNSLNYYSNDLHEDYDLNIAAEDEAEYQTKKNQGNQNNQINHSSDKGELPKGWKWVKIGEICNSIVPNRDKPKSFTGNIKWITTPNLDEKSIRLNYENVKLGLSEIETKEYNARVIPVDSVIMTCVGTFGLSAVVEEPIVINQQLHAFITNDKVNPKYLAYCIQSNKYYFESKSTSTTIQYLNKTNCNSMPFPLCSIEEQIYIVQEIESRLSVADKMEESINQSLQQAEALRQSILKKSFEGRLI